MSRTVHVLRRGALAGVAACAFSGAALAATASAPKISPQGPNNPAALRMARVIAVNPDQVRYARFEFLPPRGNGAAIATGKYRAFAGFPRAGSQFGILSTGCATIAAKPNNRGDSGCRDAGHRIDGATDVTQLDMKLRVPKGANCLSFRFRFLSEEYPEFVKSDFNDTFLAMYDKPSWQAQGGTRVKAPANFAVTRDGHKIGVNNTTLARVSPGNAKGTTYDAATRVLRASHPTRPGTHWLFLTIFDQGDRQYDSAAFVDQLTLNHRASCQSGLAKG